ncbi:MAG: hypothetical protein DRP87_14825 [Spirochaetes bacterium]|nr:MAG: hypothetical protein DRP87_14825 [Spirochaetota bacterium]
MFIPRRLSDRIKRLLRHFPALILTGARQSGKTTLLKVLFPHYRYVSLDLPSKAEQAENSPEEFLAEYGTPLIVDEIQYAPGFFRHLKSTIDADRARNGRFILTGSQKFPLMKHVSDSLAGRCAVLELENLALAEMTASLNLKSSKEDLLRLITTGQFPALWKDPDVPIYDYYSSYLATYLERDVRQIMNIVSLRDFERFIRILAFRNGSMLNKTEVAKEVGVSVKAIGDWISILHASGQIMLLEPWFSNFGKRVVKTPKLYFSDTGLLCFLLGLDKSSLLTSPFLGSVWETFLYAEIRKVNQWKERPANIWYYRDQRAREVDFLIETGGFLHFVESKWSETPRETDAKVIETISKELEESKLQWRPGKRIILAPISSSYILKNGIRVMGQEDIPSI